MQFVIKKCRKYGMSIRKIKIPKLSTYFFTILFQLVKSIKIALQITLGLSLFEAKNAIGCPLHQIVLYYKKIMKILKMFAKKKAERRNSITDFYQQSVEKIGRDQIKKIVERGLSMPVGML